MRRSAPELFPAGFDQGYCLHGFGRESLKLSGLKLRKIVLANGASYWLRPSFIFSYMTGTADELAYPLLLAAHGVPPWLLTIGFGHSDMYWYRVIERLGRNSLVGTQQFPACGFRPENTLVLISHFANSLRTMLSRIPYLTTWANGVTRHGTCFR